LARSNAWLSHRVVGTLPPDVYTLTVSPDESTVLYDRVVITRSDLWMIENFR
jgi:hypothetical protein